jgi:hypothetical protein
VSERDEVDASAAKVLDQIQRSYEDIVGAEPARARGAASSVPAPAEIFVDWDTVASRFSQATTLAILGIDDSSREIRSQPAMELKGRVADWVAEIRRLRDEGESVLFVAATPGRAERTIELLKEYDVFAVPVERAEDARYAVVLVAVARFRAASACPTPACRSTPSPTSSKKSGARPSGGARRPRRSCRTCAISRSATTSCTSTTASACSSA